MLLQDSKELLNNVALVVKLHLVTVDTYSMA
jgi:hypothetical protein